MSLKTQVEVEVCGAGDTSFLLSFEELLTEILGSSIWSSYQFGAMLRSFQNCKRAILVQLNADFWQTIQSESLSVYPPGTAWKHQEQICLKLYSQFAILKFCCFPTWSFFGTLFGYSWDFHRLREVCIKNLIFMKWVCNLVPTFDNFQLVGVGCVTQDCESLWMFSVSRAGNLHSHWSNCVHVNVTLWIPQKQCGVNMPAKETSFLENK